MPCPRREIAAPGGGMTPLQCRRDPTIRRSHRGSPRPGDGTFHPMPFGALAASAKDLPASLNAASNACGHHAHLISAISVGDISGDNADGRVGGRSPSDSLLGQSPNRQNRRRARCDRRRALPRCLPNGRGMCARDRFWSRVRETGTVRRTGTNRVGSLAGSARGGCSAMRPPGPRRGGRARASCRGDCP